MATALAIEGFSATHRTLVTILQGMVLRGFVSSHRIEEAGPLLSLGSAYARISCNYCVEVKDLESKVPGASGSRASVQHRPHQRALRVLLTSRSHVRPVLTSHQHPSLQPAQQCVLQADRMNLNTVCPLLGRHHRRSSNSGITAGLFRMFTS